MRRLARDIATMCCALTAAALAPAAASAATASVPVFSGGFPAGTFQEDLYYIASPGEKNDLTVVEPEPEMFRLHDAGATITPGALCSAVDPHTVVCKAKRMAGVNLGDRDDRAMLSLSAGQLPSGEEPQPKAFIVAGPGNDVITLRTTTPPKPNRSSDFTSQGVFRGTFAVEGGPGDDVITGSADGDILQGGPGNDKIDGGGGDDVVAGGTGNDIVNGDAGADFLLGGDLSDFELGTHQAPGHDTLGAGSGDDLVAPGPGGSAIDGGPGHDTLLYALERAGGHRPPAPVSVRFDGRGNDGPPGSHDNVDPTVENVISVGSGFFSLAGSFVLDRGVYALAGGTSLQAAITVLSRSGTSRSQNGTFSGSSFTVHPGTRTGATTLIKTTGGNFKPCSRKSKRPLAVTARKRPHKVRRLFGSATGNFTTQGGGSAGSVRDPVWITTDRCDGTLTTVLSGVVSVRDFKRHKTVLVHAGHSYLARV